MFWLRNVLRRAFGDTLLYMLVSSGMALSALAIWSALNPKSPGTLGALFSYDTTTTIASCLSPSAHLRLTLLLFSSLTFAGLVILVLWHAFLGMRISNARKEAEQTGVAPDNLEAFIQSYMLASSLLLVLSIVPATLLLWNAIEMWSMLNALIARSTCWIRQGAAAPFEGTVVAYLFSDPIFTRTSYSSPSVWFFLLDIALRGAMLDIMEHFHLSFSPLEVNPKHRPFLWLSFAYRLFVAGAVVRGLQSLFLRAVVRHLRPT